MGDDDDFEVFVEASTHHLRRLATALSGRLDADDLVQATFERLYRRWRTFRPDEPLAYARRTLIHLHASEMRRPFRRVERSDLATTEDWSAAARPGRTEGQIDDQAADRALLLDALATLALRQRQIVILRYLEDMSVADTAALLSCSEGTVKRGTHTGLRALRAALPLGDEPPCTTPEGAHR